MRRFVERHPLVVYFALAFVISWGGLLWTAGGPGGIPVAPGRVDALLPGMILSVLAGPSIAGILLVGLVDGRAGLRAFGSRLLLWRVEARWYLWALLTAPLLMTALLLALSMASPVFLPGIVTSPEPAFFLLSASRWGCLRASSRSWGGPALPCPGCVGDTAFPGAGLVLGLLWALWHVLPAVWLSGAASGRLALTSYLLDPFLYLVVFRVLMVWVYDHMGEPGPGHAHAREPHGQRADPEPSGAGGPAAPDVRPGVGGRDGRHRPGRRDPRRTAVATAPRAGGLNQHLRREGSP